jgi:hypothetical protein
MPIREAPDLWMSGLTPYARFNNHPQNVYGE